ncbi:roadblock/LC7 domain-containing protein [Deinococcus psychrotolerans]|uniref:Roadblock/LC7 domain-containing protein n=1 Tax=Deinococcus psychrotolerans TaxID=2489213 RepID=A0A3G8YC52_9DEIO|nr:roadblock/LC7 domain-containing protein [Deinococcus psychrotolerans]AZI42962.1 roadblock/LC7 domain-containing protein [Deinococcus psychrotolerans]
MPNPVFRLTARSLSKVVSGRAAETMLSASLRDLKLSPETVTARDMQRVLSGPLERRLSQALPGTAAFDKLQALSQRLERLDLRASDLFDQGARTVIWDQEDTDTQWSDDERLLGAPAHSPIHSTEEPSYQRPASSSSPGPSSSDLNPPISTSRAPAPPSLTTQSPAQALSFTGQNEEIVNDLSADAPTDPTLHNPPEAAIGDNFSADDFEFSDPDYVHLQAAVKRYELLTAQGQDALLYELARHPGVQTVVLCSTEGQVLSVRAPQGAPQLGSVVAATAMLFRQRELKLLSADLGNATVCMRVVGNYCVALLARGNVNVGRLLTELQQIEVSA